MGLSLDCELNLSWAKYCCHIYINIKFLYHRVLGPIQIDITYSKKQKFLSMGSSFKNIIK